MNKTEAMAALRKLYGKKAAYQYNDKALKGDELQAAQWAATAARLARDTLRERVEAMRIELLKDPTYVALKAELQAAEKAKDAAYGRSRARRVTVGYLTGIAGLEFFHVTAEADNFQDAIDLARKAKS